MTQDNSISVYYRFLQHLFLNSGIGSHRYEQNSSCLWCEINTVLSIDKWSTRPWTIALNDIPSKSCETSWERLTTFQGSLCRIFAWKFDIRLRYLTIIIRIISFDSVSLSREYLLPTQTFKHQDLKQDTCISKIEFLNYSPNAYHLLNSWNFYFEIDSVLVVWFVKFLGNYLIRFILLKALVHRIIVRYIRIVYWNFLMLEYWPISYSRWMNILDNRNSSSQFTNTLLAN